MQRLYYYILILILSGFIQDLSATPPERIFPMARKQMSVDYYLQQGQLWKAELTERPQNPTGWFNYYKAARYANSLTKNTIKPFNLTEIYDEAMKVIPLTFEGHYMSYLENAWTDKGTEHLLKAHYLAPHRYEAYHGLIGDYEFRGDREGVKAINKKWYDSGTYSGGLLHWNYNLLMSLEEDAIVLTAGDNDTYPIWLLQDVKGIRKDVRAINIHLLANLPDYTKLIIKELGIKEPFVTKASSQNKQVDVIQFLAKHAKRPLYLAITSGSQLQQQFGDQLYLTGLAFKVSNKTFDNVAVLKNNFENRFMTDYLHINLQNDTSISVVNQINLNYLPPLITLYEHYKTSGDLQAANEIKQLTLGIAESGKRLKSVRDYFAENAPVEPIDSGINFKNLEKSLVPVQGSLYANTTEVSNKEYEAFLIDLVKNRRFDLLETCKIQATDWRTLLPTAFQKLSDKDIFPNGHPDSADAPVQNITQAAALAYCDWMTEVYNQSIDKRKKFKKVKFRLPTQTEWVTAAKGQQNSNIYSWDKVNEAGAKPVNMKGCYLANFYVSDQAPCDDCDSPTKATSQDGGFFPVKVDAYFPNDIKLYNTIGNVAEMVQQAGIARGGSWEDTPQEATLTSVKRYTERSPAVGFRVFMEIIE
ncbi:MAG: formylglycine-generating enzyme family protein [Saprospiraceae bacterium]